MSSGHPLQVVSFVTDLGWMALVARGSLVKQLAFGYASEIAALHAFDRALIADAHFDDGLPELVERLQAYAAGAPIDFADVEIDLDHLTPFQRRVIKHCRAIGYGQTCSYADLAEASGSPRAARAVGNTMAGNRYPLLVPCHRVVHADGRLGHYSSHAGPSMKTRLLDLERTAPANSVPSGRRPKQARRALVRR